MEMEHAVGSGHPGNSLPAQPGDEIQLRLPTLGRFFDPMDPSPTPQKDLHPSVEEFIVSWGREVPTKASLALLTHLDQPASEAELQDAAAAIHAFFEERAAVTRRQLRRLFQVGRISLVIALAVLSLSILVGELLVARAEGSGLRMALGSTLEVGGWVAMWRPLQIFLYDWWPILADLRLYRRFAAMPVRFAVAATSMGKAWTARGE
jgi:hypothetical protein